MSMSHDDLPHSPSGRLPRWVVEEAEAREAEAQRAGPRRWGASAPGEAPAAPSSDGPLSPPPSSTPRSSSWGTSSSFPSSAPSSPSTGPTASGTSWPTAPSSWSTAPPPPPASPAAASAAAWSGAPSPTSSPSSGPSNPAPTTPPPSNPAESWYAAPPQEPRRRSLAVRVGIVVGAAALALWFAIGVLPGLLREADAPFLDGIVAGRVPDPTPEVEELAGEMFLTGEGRDLLYMAQPELLGAEEFAGRCDRGGSGAAGETGGAVGCYHSSAGGLQAGGRIVIYTPADERLRPFVVETAAHELLHAAWNELDDAEQAAATRTLATVLSGVDAEDDIHEQIAGSVAGQAANRPTELFAYIGTQVWREGGLDDDLEALYARFIADREALVGVHTAFEAQLDQMTTDLTTAQQALAQRQYDQGVARAQLEADSANLAQYRSTIEEEEARLASLSSSVRSRSLLAWTWRDGTPLPEQPAAELLAKARELLARDEAELAARGESIAAGDAEVAAETERVEGLRADLQSLFDQLDPTRA